MSQSGRILIVDDEVTARCALAELLGEEGYIVETAADGQDALAKLNEFAADAVVTDLQMPGIDGLAVIAKAIEQDPERAVIVMTAVGAADAAAAAMRAGAIGYLTKPIDFDALLLVLARGLERRRWRTEAD